jgi:sugar phosphate permease
MADAPQAPTSWRYRMFGLTWLSYFSYYFARKNFSIVKKSIEDIGLGTKADFAWIDTAYLVSYAAGQFIWGFTADRVSPRKLLAFGMLGTAALAMLAGLGGTLGIILIAFGLNGLTQSTGWPSNGRIMASWFGTHERGVVMGFWGTCYQVGPIAAAAFAAYLLGRYGWQAAFIGPAIWVAVVAIALLLLLRDKPSSVGFKDPDAAPARDLAEARRLRSEAWRQMLRRPTVWLLGANYFCVKFIRYSIWFWLPYYLATRFEASGKTAGLVSTSFDVGGVVGVIAAGLLADRLFARRRIAVALVGMLLLAGTLFLYGSDLGPTSMGTNFAWLVVIGVFLFGADSIVSGVAAQDAGGPHAAALACGFVNGLGSLGAVAQSFLLVYITEQHGWDALFTVFMVLSLVAAAVLIPLWRLSPE